MTSRTYTALVVIYAGVAALISTGIGMVLGLLAYGSPTELTRHVWLMATVVLLTIIAGLSADRVMTWLRG